MREGPLLFFLFLVAKLFFSLFSVFNHSERAGKKGLGSAHLNWADRTTMNNNNNVCSSYLTSLSLPWRPLGEPAPTLVP
jgi:hypothetical protein